MADATIQLEVKLENGQFKVSSKQVQDGIDNIEKKSVSGINRMGTALKSFLALGIVSAIYQFGKSALQASANMEKMKVSFETMLGSSSKAKTVLGELRTFAASTPLQFEGLAESTKTLLNFGIAGDDAVDVIKMLGDVSGGNQAKLDSLALAFGQMSSTGKLMGQDLLQMINAGFNPLQQISEDTGVSMGVLKDQMSKGQITVKQVKDAFKSATSEGGRFFGMLEKQSTTLVGKFSTLKDNIQLTLIEVGDKLAPAFKRLIDAFSLGVRGTSIFSKALSLMVTVVSKVVDAISLLVGSIQFLTNKVASFYNRIQRYMLMQKINAKTEAEFLRRASQDKADQMRQLLKESGQYASEDKKIKQHIINTASALIGIEREQQKEVKETLKLRKEAASLDVQKTQKGSKAQQEFNERVRLMDEFYGLKWGKEEEDALKQADDHSKAAGLYQKYLLSKFGMDRTYVQGLQTVMSQSSIFLAQTNKKLFNFGKILAIGQAMIQQALALVRVWADLPFWAAAPASVIIGTATALQIKAIKKQKPPEYETGEWEVPQTGPAIIHRGEMILNKSSAEMVRSAASGHGVGQTIVNNYMVRGDDFVAVMEKKHQENADLLGGDFINYNNVYD